MNNSITARTGIAVGGFLATNSISFAATNNRASNIEIMGNSINQRPLKQNDNQRTAGIVVADVVELWYKLGGGQMDTLDALMGNGVSNVTVQNNTIAADFATHCMDASPLAQAS